jgi:hypothetical protein
MVRSVKKSQEVSARQTKPQPKATKKVDKSPPRATKKAPGKFKPIAKAKAKAVKSQKVAASKAQPVSASKAPRKAAKVAKVTLVPIVTRAPPKAPRATKPAKSSGPKGYTPAQYQKFKELKEKFEEYSNQKLKDLLRANTQSMTGNKDDLIYKCADGAILGRIPRCPKCFGGRPKFDYQKGTYYCSGYRDDEDFKNCHSTFQLSELTRDPWTDI